MKVQEFYQNDFFSTYYQILVSIFYNLLCLHNLYINTSCSSIKKKTNKKPMKLEKILTFSKLILFLGLIKCNKIWTWDYLYNMILSLTNKLYVHFDNLNLRANRFLKSLPK